MEELDKELTTPVDAYYSDENLTPLEVCEKINRLCGLNIFKNTRKREVIEMRALACYISVSYTHLTLPTKRIV